MPSHTGVRRPGAAAKDVDLYVGARIRLRRKDLNLTQQQLAIAVGLTFQQIQKYESGANRVSASRLYAIAQQLSAPIAYFFDGLDQAQGQPDGGEEALIALLRTSEGPELATAFPRLKRGAVRRQFLALVRALSAADRSEAARPAGSSS